MKRILKKRMWLAGASVLAIVLGSGAANAVVFGLPGFSEYITPSTGWYNFKVAGAQGGASINSGGAGAVVGGELFLHAGTSLFALVGEQGGSGFGPFGDGLMYNDGAGGGGGGFSDVFSPTLPLFIAGGGGGGGWGNINGSFYGPGGPGIGSFGAPGFNYPSGGAGGLGVVGTLSYLYVGYTRVPATAGGYGGYGTKLEKYPGVVVQAGPNGGFYGQGGGGGYNGGGGGGGDPGGGPGQGGSSYVSPLVRDPFGMTGGNGNTDPFSAANGYVSINFVGSSVPEPSTWAMMLAGFSLLGGMLVRRGKKTTSA